MNDYDSNRIVDLLGEAMQLEKTDDLNEADVVVLNTCSIREKAQEKVFSDLGRIREAKRDRPDMMIAVGGCVASQEGAGIVKRAPWVDVVFGPQTMHRLPEMLGERARTGKPQVDVSFPEIEKFDHLPAPRAEGAAAFVSIMEGCSKYCTYCVVPYTRGEEISRPLVDVLVEVAQLADQGVKEVTLLGQNVNSYRWKEGTAEAVDFPALVERVAGISPLLRVRFATSHPKDLSDRLIEVMASYPNICRAVHLPAQSGSDRMLAAMNRKYTRAWYLERVAAIRRRMPDCAVTTDLIAGFCGETAEDHAQTLSLMREVGYDSAYMFKYSQRPGTLASRTMTDDVSEEVKTARLNEIIALQNELSTASNERDMGNVFEVLVEGLSRRSSEQLCGRTSQNKMVVFDRTGETAPGDCVRVRITGCTSATLFGVAE